MAYEIPEEHQDLCGAAEDLDKAVDLLTSAIEYAAGGDVRSLPSDALRYLGDSLMHTGQMLINNSRLLNEALHQGPDLRETLGLDEAIYSVARGRDTVLTGSLLKYLFNDKILEPDEKSVFYRALDTHPGLRYIGRGEYRIVSQ